MYHAKIVAYGLLGEVNIDEDMDFPNPPTAFDVIRKWMIKDKELSYTTIKALSEDAINICMEITYCSITLKI